VSKWRSGARFVPALRSNAVQCYRLSSLSGLRFVRGGSRVGVCCPRRRIAGGVGCAVRAAHGADLNRECWRERWRGTWRVVKGGCRVVRAALGADPCRRCRSDWWRSVILCMIFNCLEGTVQSVRVAVGPVCPGAVFRLVALDVSPLLKFRGSSVGRVVRAAPLWLPGL
jgi:hypothetical protein